MTQNEGMICTKKKRKDIHKQPKNNIHCVILDTKNQKKNDDTYANFILYYLCFQSLSCCWIWMAL